MTPCVFRNLTSRGERRLAEASGSGVAVLVAGRGAIGEEWVR